MSNEGRLPKPTGRVPPRVRLALRLYRRLWVDDRTAVPQLKLTMYSGMLSAALQAMTRQELAEYYAGVRGLEGR